MRPAPWAAAFQIWKTSISQKWKIKTKRTSKIKNSKKKITSPKIKKSKIQKKSTYNFATPPPWGTVKCKWLQAPKVPGQGFDEKCLFVIRDCLFCDALLRLTPGDCALMRICNRLRGRGGVSWQNWGLPIIELFIIETGEISRIVELVILQKIWSHVLFISISPALPSETSVA